jgi:hypothetical protein
VCGLFGIPGSSQGAADLKDEHGGVEGQIVEPLAHILRLLVDFASQILDALEDVYTDFDGVLPGKVLVVFGVELVVTLRLGQLSFDSLLKGSHWALVIVSRLPDIVGVV